jgi:hypothetical protein
MKSSFRPPRPSGIPGCGGEESSAGILPLMAHDGRYFPQAQVETSAPPVLRKKHLGKEAPAGVVLRLLAFLSKKVFSTWQLAFSLQSFAAIGQVPIAKC